MKIRRANVTLTGTTPLLLRRHNPDGAEAITAWRKDPANKEYCTAGDDRSPAWTYVSSIYHDGHVFGVPSDNLMTMLREGGAKVPASKRGTLKRATQSGLIVLAPMWPIVSGETGRMVEIAPVLSLVGERDFAKHVEHARASGYELQCKGSRVNKTRHIRVRPMFAAGWQISGEISVVDDAITNEAFELILSYAGSYAGLGDWRPSSPMAPGPYGQFTAEVKWIK